MKILGVFAHGQNPAAALIIDGALVAMAEEERFTRFKVSHALQPERSIRYCLEEAGIEMSDVDEIAFGWDAPRYLNEVPRHYGRVWFGQKDWRALGEGLGNKLRARFLGGAADQDEGGSVVEGTLNILNCHPDVLRNNLTYAIRRSGYFGPMPPIVFYPHHKCHAASTYYASGFERAGILTVDGHGEITCTELFAGAGLDIRSLKKITVPNSLGWFYSAFTEYLGFLPYSDEGKLMGLAPYGEASAELDALMARVLRLTPDGYALDAEMTFLGKRTYGRNFSDGLVELFGAPRGTHEPLTQRHKDIALATQTRLEQAVLHLAGITVEQTKSKDLCLAGGVAMNCKANGELARSGIVDRLFVQAASSDAGTALGAAMLAAVAKGDDPRFTQTHTYFGPAFDEAAIRAALDESKLTYERADDICEAAAERLAEGKLLGWFQGRMEYGARALGNRSVLANPLMAEVHKKVNAEVKHRELWRPFAPAMTRSFSDEWLEPSVDAPFMITAAWVKEGWADKLPAVVHVDGSVRPQTVTEEQNPRYFRLIKAFGKRTGVECVLNTSMNDKGEPVVCTPREAIKFFAASGLDTLAIGDFVLDKTRA